MTPPHLDDDALSAALDGELSGDVDAHLSGCATCHARLEALARVAAAVGSPLSPRPAEEVDAVIRAALAAWE